MRILETALDDGTRLDIQVVEPRDTAEAGSFRQPMGVVGDVAKCFNFKEVIAQVREPISLIMATLQDLPRLPDKLEVELGVGFSTEGTLIIAAAKGDVNLMVRLTWSPHETAANAMAKAEASPVLTPKSTGASRVHKDP